MTTDSTAEVRELRGSPKKLSPPKNPLIDEHPSETLEAVASVLTFLRYHPADKHVGELVNSLAESVEHGRLLVLDCVIAAVEHAQAQLGGQRQEV